MNDIVTWILSTLLMLSPYQSSVERGFIYRYQPDLSKDAHYVRMRSIAEDFYEVVDTSKPLPGLSKRDTLRLGLSIAYFESGYQKDVDLGLGRWGKGDHGKAFCLMQIETGGDDGHVPVVDPEVKEWTGKDLLADRKKCIKAGYAALRQSMGACSLQKDSEGKPLKGSALISAYTSGTCKENEPAARSRWGFAWRGKIGRDMPKWPKREEKREAPSEEPKVEALATKKEGGGT